MHPETMSDGDDETKRAVAACDGSGGYHAGTRQRQQWSDGADRLRIFAVAQTAAMVLIAAVLFVLEMWTPELYFVISFLGLLVLRIVLAPTDRIPTWWSRLNWVVRAGFVVFAYLVLQQLPELLP